ncbi:hypothetical protein COLU111180_12140 [Cohnella lubricantis]|uniref:Uncharacterized protein n=1 Tax=Cohnella lubricantis TaxID=2163172 RepID=A0A841T9M1_9BACL|nr:hypothetical protein [Cohnella lubricantis]MBB6675950.1 hypothetical protein [Cohnella lubricantis]MBP2117933.1 hypothetical protein [Cohnella lubricantis]
MNEQYVVTRRSLDFGHVVIPIDTILFVHKHYPRCSFRVLSGVFAGLFVGVDDVEPFSIWQELLQRREEVDELTRERDALLQTIERTIDEQKPVVLPREVCNALDTLKAQFALSDTDFHAWYIAQENNEHEDREWLKLLRDRANSDSFLDIVDALRYGYKVEEPEPVLTIEEEVAGIISEWLKEEPNSSERDDNLKLACRIVERIKQKEQEERVG